MKEICNGKINTSGFCEKCYQVSQTTSGYCSRLIEVEPVEQEKSFKAYSESLKHDEIGNEIPIMQERPSEDESPFLNDDEQREIRNYYSGQKPSESAEEILKKWGNWDKNGNAEWHKDCIIKAVEEYASQKHLPTEIFDILNCIAKFDVGAEIYEKADYFDVIQKDVQKWLRDNIK